MDLSIRKIMLAGIATSAFVAIADSQPEYNARWIRGDGTLTDPAKNSRNEPLTKNHQLYFEHAAEGQPMEVSHVSVPDGSSLSILSLQSPWTEWTGTAGLDDACAVTLVGPSKLWLQDWRYARVPAGRQLTLDGVKIEHANLLDAEKSDGGLIVDGRMLMKNGSEWVATTNGMYATVGATGELTVKESAVRFYSLSVNDQAKVRLFSGEVDAPRWQTGNYCSQTNVQIRDAALHVAANLQSPSFFPSGRKGVFDRIGASDTAFSPTLESGAKIALRGRAQATNNTGSISQCILTNDVAFYGRGTLNVGNLRLRDGFTYDFDLARLELGYRVVYQGNPSGVTDPPVVNFRNGVYLKMYGNSDGAVGRTPDFFTRVGFFGDTTIDIRDLYTEQAGTAGFKNTLRFFDRSSVTFCGGTFDRIGFSRVPVRFAKYEIGEGTTVVEDGSDKSVPCWRRTHAYVLGKDAVHRFDASGAEFVEVASDRVSVDPSSTLVADVSATASDDVSPVFCSLAKGPLACSVQVANVWPGASVKWVGGTAYYSTGLKDYGGKTEDGRWLGAKSGLWSDSENWGNGRKPSAGYNAIFKGETQTILTNDLAEAVALQLYYLGGAPFILRGNKIIVYRTKLGPDLSVAVSSEAALPFVIECPLEAVGDFGCNSLYWNRRAQGMVALMGPVDASSGIFGPSGNIVVGNTVDCRELVLQKPAHETPYAYGDDSTGGWKVKFFTELTVLDGGTVNVSAQTTANTEQGGLWIDKGGAVNVTGRWDWTTAENEHQVNGLLDLSAATVGGDAAQGYFGTGRVRIGATDGTAAVRLGEGITLETTAANWGTMPIEMASSLTISNRTDWTYTVAGGLRVTGPGHTLTVYVAKDTVTTFETGIDGHDFDIVKIGEGKLVLKGDLDGLKRGTLDIRSGTVAFDGALKVRTLVSSAGSALAFGATDGVAASLFVDDDVDLSNLTFKAADGGDSSLSSYQTVLTVPWDCEFVGDPTVDGVKLRSVVNADGSKSLQAKARNGFMLFVR